MADTKEKIPEKGEILEVEYTNRHTLVPDVPDDLTAADTIVERDFIRFGVQNNFPSAIQRLNRQSVTHRSIINAKAVYITGKGFNFDDSNSFLEEFTKTANSENQSLKNVSKNLIKDFSGGGNAYLEIVTDPQQSFLNFFQKDWTKGRVAKTKDGIFFHPKWRLYQSKKSLAKFLPSYPNFELIDGLMRSVFHFKEYESEFTNYGLPVWISGLDAAGIAYKTTKWNLSRLDNSFQSSGIVLVDGKIGKKDAEDLKKEFKKEFTGEKKQGQIMFIIKQLGGGGTTFTPINEGAEGDWIKLHAQSDQDIITAHNWFRSLSGLSDNTGFDTNRIRQEYEVALNTVIIDQQDFFAEQYRRIIEEVTGVDASSLRFVNESPISIADQISSDKVVKKGEARELLGLPVDENDPRMDEFIDDGTTKTLTLE